ARATLARPLARSSRALACRASASFNSFVVYWDGSDRELEPLGMRMPAPPHGSGSTGRAWGRRSSASPAGQHDPLARLVIEPPHIAGLIEGVEEDLATVNRRGDLHKLGNARSVVAHFAPLRQWRHGHAEPSVAHRLASATPR